MDSISSYGVQGGSTTLKQCAAAVLRLNGREGCIANYFFFESAGYCNCPRDATCSGSANNNAGGSGQLYQFVSAPPPPPLLPLCTTYCGCSAPRVGCRGDCVGGDPCGDYDSCLAAGVCRESSTCA